MVVHNLTSTEVVYVFVPELFKTKFGIGGWEVMLHFFATVNFETNRSNITLKEIQTLTEVY